MVNVIEVPTLVVKSDVSIDTAEVSMLMAFYLYLKAFIVCTILDRKPFS